MLIFVTDLMKSVPPVLSTISFSVKEKHQAVIIAGRTCQIAMRCASCCNRFVKQECGNDSEGLLLNTKCTRYEYKQKHSAVP